MYMQPASRRPERSIMGGTIDMNMPARLLNARRLCKDSTADIIDWLSFTSSIRKKPAIQQSKKRRGKPKTQGHGTTNGEKIMKVDEIVSCANCIIKSNATRPQYIRSAFKKALVNRRVITAWYRTREVGDNESTRRHEHFTDTLNQAYDILFPPTAEDRLVDRESSSRRSSQFANAFGPLDGIPTDKESTLSEAEMQDLLASWMDSSAKPRSRIADDDLDEQFNRYAYVLEMDLMVDTIKGYWRRVAKGEMSVPLAAWLTHVGYSGIARMCEEHRNSQDIDHEKLVHAFMSRQANVQITSERDLSQQGANSAGHDSQYQEFSAGLALIKPTRPLHDWKWSKQMDRASNLALCAASPFDYFMVPSEETAQDSKLHFESSVVFLEPWTGNLPAHELDTLLAVKEKLMQRDSASIDSLIATILFLIDNPIAFGDRAAQAVLYPMKAEVDFFMRREFSKHDTTRLGKPEKGPRRTADTEAVFGMVLLLETSKSFFYIDDVQNRTNLHTRAVRLAEEVQECMDRLIEADFAAGDLRNMSESTIDTLEDKRTELDRYIKSDGSTLYHQMPWTAGSHMGEILYSAMDLGFTVCSTRDMLGKVLHAYNAVRTVGRSKTTPILLLEQLCDLFSAQIFLGARPNAKFHPTYWRFLGGKPERTTDQHKNPGRAAKSKFQTGAPRRRYVGGTDRFKPSELSLFHHLRSSKPALHGTPDLWAKVFTQNRIKSPNKKQSAAIDQEMRDAPFAAILERLKAAATAEFEGPFPIAKMNWFKVYELVVSILIDIAQRYQREIPAGMEPYRNTLQPAPAIATAGCSFVNILSQLIDGRLEHPRSWNGNEFPGLEMTWDAFEKCAGTVKIEDLLWKNA
ncbi:hypothetical protein TI39_contig446g00003 [Zymoseptoria brevis]|uniref:DUF6604 domain-containing protein n=1 Tax=Zymoseptoria brevis TaxID=1047168 RepID=A0A0F4GKV1_9PEZI|nr:hypothetical protein TI39_contig446g00003 [Zymoseptoria brevis]